MLSSEKGTGRLSNMMGKLHCELANGIKFKVGTGFSDAQRKNPPKKGAVITFKFQEVSDSGVPRFPVFLRIREDVTWAEVKENAKKSAPKSQDKKKSFHLKKGHSKKGKKKGLKLYFIESKFFFFFFLKAVLYTTVPSRDQETNKKQGFPREICNRFVFNNFFKVTDDDVNDAPLNEPGGTASPSTKPPCKYGKLCYQTNEAHLLQFYHEPKEEDKKKKTSKKKETEKIPCKFGAECYQSNSYHREKVTICFFFFFFKKTFFVLPLPKSIRMMLLPRRRTK